MKVYSKPEIIFDDFSLSTNIAAGCEFKTNLQSQEEQCAYLLGGDFGDGIAVFTDSMRMCVDSTNVSVGLTGAQYGSGNDMICYHVPNQDRNVFNS